MKFHRLTRKDKLKRAIWTCGRKKKYHDRFSAFNRWIDIASNGEWHYGFEIYLCPNCGYYHVGHKNQGNRKKFRRKILEQRSQKRMLVRAWKLQNN